MNLLKSAVSECGGVFPTNDVFWLNAPQAVILEATRDIELALDLTVDSPALPAETAALLEIKASRRLASRRMIPPEADGDAEQWGDARKRYDAAKAILRPDYLEVRQQVNRRLASGVRTKARRTPGGLYESVDPVEYIGTELQGLDAIDKRTRRVRLFDILINAFDYTEHVTGQPIRPASAGSSPAADQVAEPFSQEVDKWECT